MRDQDVREPGESVTVNNNIESDYLSETCSGQPRLYRIVALHESDKLTRTDREQLLRCILAVFGAVNHLSGPLRKQNFT